MAAVYYEGPDGTLCFKHAVQLALKDESIYAHADDNNSVDMNDSCFGIHICVMCVEVEEY